jgi:uncharacterized protein with ParB-like and HNH nuclease domain
MERIINKDGASNANFYEFILKGGDIVIPQYQRFYEWGEDLVSQLLDDIVESLGKRNLFIGVVIYKEKSDRQMVVVDGQQRIVTFLILLRALINSGLLKKSEAESIAEYLRKVPASDKAVFAMNERDRRYFFKRHILLGEKVSDDDRQKISLDKIIRSEELLTKKLKRMTNTTLSKIYSFLKNNVEIVYICLSDKADENDIFESINAKKLSLSDADLLKNYFLSKCHQQGELEMANATWDEMYRLLESVNQVDKFFEVYYTMKYGVVIKTEEEEEEENLEKHEKSKEKHEPEEIVKHQENKLYHKYRNQKEIKCSDDHISILKDMLVASGKYKNIVDSSIDAWGKDNDARAINRALQNLDYLGFTTAYPLILRVVKEVDPPKKSLLVIIEMCEAYAFLQRSVNKTLPQPIKDYFNSYNKQLIAHPTPEQVVSMIQSIYKDIIKLKKDNRFVDMFVAKSFKSTDLKYFLCRIYFGKSVSSMEKRTIYGLLDSSSWEHIMPKQSDEWQADIERFIKEDSKDLNRELPEEFRETHNSHRKVQLYHESFINRIGNASLLANSENSKIKNQPFTVKSGPKFEIKKGKKIFNEKKAFYTENEPNNYLFKGVLKSKDWSWREINTRTLLFINDYFKLIENSKDSII